MTLQELVESAPCSNCHEGIVHHVGTYFGELVCRDKHQVQGERSQAWEDIVYVEMGNLEILELYKKLHDPS